MAVKILPPMLIASPPYASKPPRGQPEFLRCVSVMHTAHHIVLTDEGQRVRHSRRVGAVPANQGEGEDLRGTLRL